MSHRFSLFYLKEVIEPIERPEIPVPDKIYRQLGVKLWGEGAYERESIDGIQTKYKTLSRVEAKDIVVNKIWARNGSVAIVPESLSGCYVSGEFPTFKPIEDKLEPRWFHWLTKTKEFWRQCDEKSQGTSGKNRIRPERFLEIEIPLPPIEEQRRIVARIEELAARIEEARELRRRAVEETGALLIVASKRFFSKNNVQTPKKELKDLATRITKGESPEWQGFTYHDNGPLFVRSENVLWGRLDLSKRICIPIEFHKKLNRSQLHPGDVLINLVGASIGRACIVPSSLEDANINQAVAVISPNFELLNSEYLMHFLLSAQTQEIIHGGKVETARPNISLSDIRNLLLPVPSLMEQRRIVAYLESLQSKLDALRRYQAETAAALDALLPAVLERAFRGEL